MSKIIEINKIEKNQHNTKVVNLLDKYKCNNYVTILNRSSIEKLEKCRIIFNEVKKNKKLFFKDEVQQLLKEVLYINAMRFSYLIKKEDLEQPEDLEIHYNYFFFDEDREKVESKATYTLDLSSELDKKEDKKINIIDFTHKEDYFYRKLKRISNALIDITKHDKEIDASYLSQKEVIQAFNNSISKFIELYYQQPKEYKPILKNYDVSVVDSEVSVIQSMVQNSDDIKILKKLFRIYKEDTQGVIYNYSLFAFIYFSFALKVSNEYIYNSQILKSLNLYKIERDRKKPTIKKNAITILKTQQIIYKELDDKESVFIDSLIEFLKEYMPKKYNYYSIAYLTNELQNSLTASKSFIESFEDKSYKKLTKKMLPKVINTILPPVEKIICI